MVGILHVLYAVARVDSAADLMWMVNAVDVLMNME